MTRQAISPRLAMRILLNNGFLGREDEATSGVGAAWAGGGKRGTVNNDAKRI